MSGARGLCRHPGALASGGSVAAVRRLNRALSVALVVGLSLFTSPMGAALPGTPDVSHPEIVGGTEVPPGAYPFMAALVWSGYANARTGQFCGGSMIDAEWILTAAHCTDGSSPGDIDVVVGRRTLTSTDGERIGVAEIHEHPDYDSSTYENDISLLKLENPATVGDPIRWVIDGEADLFAAGTLATTIGWGLTEDDPAGTGTGKQDTLREVDLPIRTTAECDASYPGSPPQFVDGVMICAGYPAGGKDSCQGDSGGPLIISTGTGMAHVGVVSWGEGCADPGNYGVYTRTASFSDWILEVTAIDECTGIHPTAVGTAADEEMLGSAGTDVIHGEGGNDILRGRYGDDILCGGAGNDYLYTGPDDDIAYGGDGQDRLFGMGGLDVLHGEEGNDQIKGGPGDDVVSGGYGDDVIRVHGGNDLVFGDGGADTIYGGSGNDILRGGDGADIIYGITDGDFINGDAGDDEVRGQSGDDEVRGGGDNDQVYGGTGTDTIMGGSGTDTCTGGEIGLFSCETIL